MCADHDLMTLTRSNARGEILFTERAEIERLFAAVVPVLNRGFGARTIPHG